MDPFALIATLIFIVFVVLNVIGWRQELRSSRNKKK